MPSEAFTATHGRADLLPLLDQEGSAATGSRIACRHRARRARADDHNVVAVRRHGCAGPFIDARYKNLVLSKFSWDDEALEDEDSRGSRRAEKARNRPSVALCSRAGVRRIRSARIRERGYRPCDLLQYIDRRVWTRARNLVYDMRHDLGSL